MSEKRVSSKKSDKKNTINKTNKTNTTKITNSSSSTNNVNNANNENNENNVNNSKENLHINSPKKNLCNFIGRKNVPCGKLCDENKEQCPIHYNIKFPPFWEKIEKKRNDVDSNMEKDEIPKRYAKRQAVSVDDIDVNQCSTKLVQNALPKNLLDLSEITRKMDELNIVKKKFDIVNDEFDKKIMKKVQSKYYYAMKSDKAFVEKVYNSYKKKNREKTKNENDINEVNEQNETNESKNIKIKDIPHNYFHKKTNFAFEKLSEKEKQMWIKDVEKEMGII